MTFQKLCSLTFLSLCKCINYMAISMTRYSRPYQLGLSIIHTLEPICHAEEAAFRHGTTSQHCLLCGIFKHRGAGDRVLSNEELVPGH